jgi:hypothetical protein
MNSKINSNTIKVRLIVAAFLLVCFIAVFLAYYFTNSSRTSGTVISSLLIASIIYVCLHALWVMAIFGAYDFLTGNRNRPKHELSVKETTKPNEDYIQVIKWKSNMITFLSLMISLVLLIVTLTITYV